MPVECSRVSPRRSLPPVVSGYLSYLAWMQYKLGSWLAHHGQDAEATKAFRRSLQVWEQFADTHKADQRATDGLAWLLATCPLPHFQDGPRAVAEVNRQMTTEKETIQDPELHCFQNPELRFFWREAEAVIGLLEQLAANSVGPN